MAKFLSNKNFHIILYGERKLEVQREREREREREGEREKERVRDLGTVHLYKKTHTYLLRECMLTEFPHCLSELEQWMIKSFDYLLNLLP